jgi:hypothetical protein
MLEKGLFWNGVRYLRVVVRWQDGAVARKGILRKIDFPPMRWGGVKVARQ